MADLLAQKTTDEKEFIRTNGTVKYLKHLQNEKESVICPICTIDQQQKVNIIVLTIRSSKLNKYSLSVCSPRMWSCDVSHMFDGNAERKEVTF